MTSHRSLWGSPLRGPFEPLVPGVANAPQTFGGGKHIYGTMWATMLHPLVTISKYAFLFGVVYRIPL